MPAKTLNGTSGAQLHNPGGQRGNSGASAAIHGHSKGGQPNKLGAFADVYRRQCSATKGYPLSCLLTPTFFATGTLRVPCDKVITDEDWDLLIGSLATANDLRGLCLWSTWWHERKAQLLRLRSTTDVNKARESIKNKIPLVLHMEVTDPLMKSIATTMRHCKQLSSLTLAGIILHPSCVRTLATAVAKSHSLSHLSLSRCEIGDQGFREIASAIKASTSLTVLDLSDNLLTHASASLLADALKSQSVRRMESAFPYLLRATSKKSIDSAYAASSSASTSSRPFLKRVNLCCNPLTDTGLYYLLDALQSDVGVQVLDLQFTKVTHAGIEAAWLVLQDVPGTVVLDLRNNPEADADLVARLLALADHNAMFARDPELARLPDGVHPLEASLVQGANAPRVPKVKTQAPQGSRYAVPTAGKSPAKKSQAVGVQGPRPAWRPAGISQLPTGRPGDGKTKATTKRTSPGGMSPDGWHPLVDVVQMEELVVKNQALVDKVHALEHVVLKHTLEDPVPVDMHHDGGGTAPRSRVSTVGYDDGMPRLGVSNLYEMRHPERYYPSHPQAQPEAHAGGLVGLPNLYEMRHPDRYMHPPRVEPTLDRPFMDEPDEVVQDAGQRRWMVGPDGHVVDAHGRAFYQSPGIDRIMTTAVVQTVGPPAVAAPPPLTPVHHVLAPLPHRPVPAPAPADPVTPVRAVSPSSYASVVATLKSLHAQLKAVASAWDVHHARRQVLSARWSVVAGPTIAPVVPTAPVPPVITESLNKLEAMATALDRRWWDKHPDMMRRVTDVDRWVGEVAARTTAGDVDDPRVVEKDCVQAAAAAATTRGEVDAMDDVMDGPAPLGGRARELSPPLRLQDLQSGTSESGQEEGNEGKRHDDPKPHPAKDKHRHRHRTRTGSGKPPLPMVEMEEGALTGSGVAMDHHA